MVWLERWRLWIFERRFLSFVQNGDLCSTHLQCDTCVMRMFLTWKQHQNAHTQNNGFQLYLHLCLCLCLRSDFNWNKHFQTTKDNGIKILNFDAGPKSLSTTFVDFKRWDCDKFLKSHYARFALRTQCKGLIEFMSLIIALLLLFSCLCFMWLCCAILSYSQNYLPSCESVLIILDMKCSGKRDAKSNIHSIRWEHTHIYRKNIKESNKFFYVRMVSQWTYGFCCQRQLCTTPFDKAFLI